MRHSTTIQSEAGDSVANCVLHTSVHTSDSEEIQRILIDEKLRYYEEFSVVRSEAKSSDDIGNIADL